MATECQRCAAEQQARYARALASIGLVLAIVFGSCLCWIGAAASADGNQSPFTTSDYLRPLGVLVMLLAGVGSLFRASGRLSRRALTLPISEPNPAAHYREGPPQTCPRHASDPVPIVASPENNPAGARARPGPWRLPRE